MKKIVFVIFLFAPTFASAATLTLTAQPPQIGVGDTVAVTLSLDSDQAVNAFSGTLNYPKEAFELVGASDGSSIVNAWITHPSAVAPGAIEFAGVTAGGYVGRGGVLFSVLLRATQADRAQVSLADTEVLRSDGAGTQEPVSSTPLILSIARKSMGGFKEPIDMDPPEPFDLFLTNGGGAFTLIFSAVDKGSGVDHYEVAEGRLPWLTPVEWKRTNAPYIIRDQYLASDVYMKAVDRAGNERTTVFHRARLLRARLLYPSEWIIGCTLILCALLAYWFSRRDSLRPRSPVRRP